MSSEAEPILDPNAPSPGNVVKEQSPWEEAWDTLSDKDKEQYGNPSLSMLEVLDSVQKATKTRQQDCIAKGWTLYRNKNGEKVMLRHVLEKIHIWVGTIIKIVDLGVSADQSGHAALPWAIVKSITEVGFSGIEVFSKVAEGIEYVSALLSRYTIVERLYLHQVCESRSGLQEAITKLYAATLTYLAKVNAYCAKNTLGRFGLDLKEKITKQYDELYSKISETDVERWTQMADAEREQLLSQTASDLANCDKVLRAMKEDASAHDKVARGTYKKLMDTLIGLDKPIMQMSDNLSMITENLESSSSFNNLYSASNTDLLQENERAKVFSWMSKIDYKSHHDNLSKGLLAHSGQWLLKSQQFIEWGQSSMSSIFWLHGIPGSGKTGIASMVINVVTDATPNPCKSPTAFFYCARSTAEPERSKPAEIMGALLRQLASIQSDLYVKDPILNEYGARKKEAEKDNSGLKKLTVQDCTRLIVELTKYHPATIILDALDECEKDTRHELLEAFDEIISQSAEVVKVFVSSRDDVDIKLHLEKSKNISISVENNSSDIARFVQSEVDRLISQRLLLDGKVSPRLKGRIIDELTNGAQGMFRWVEMSLEALKRTECKQDFNATLGQLPSELSGLYDIIHTQICQAGPYGRDIAIQTLKWLLCAPRLLSVEELLAAVYKIDDDTCSDSDEEAENGSEQLQSPENEVLRLCRNLIVFDSEKSRVRFAHQSVREYLLTLSQYAAVEQHKLATEICLDVYLNEHSISRKGEQQNNILRRYAQLYWPVHYKHVEDSRTFEFEKEEVTYTGKIEGRSLPYVQWILDILKPYPEVHRSAHYKYAEDEASPLGGKISRFTSCAHEKSPPYVQWISDLRSSYQGVGYWSLNQSLELGGTDELGLRVDFVIHKDDTLSALASAFGMLSFLQGREPPRTEVGDLLCFAAEQGHDQIVYFLLDRGAEINGLDKFGKSRLMDATYGEDEMPCTALQLASLKGHQRIVQMLLDRGADVDAGYPLAEASFAGHEKIVQMLLDRGADVHAHYEYSDTALQAASFYGHQQIVQMLLDRRADVDAGNPLVGASSRGREKIVQMLLDRGANVHARDEYGLTALGLASKYGHEQIKQLLLGHGAVY